MSDNKSKSVEELNNEVTDLKIRLKRIEEYILDNFNFADPNTYLNHEEDPNLNEAIKLIAQYNTASASFIQRKMGIGYARAARLLDLMEEKGLVGPAEGAKPRDINLKNMEKYINESS